LGLSLLELNNPELSELGYHHGIIPSKFDYDLPALLDLSSQVGLFGHFFNKLFLDNGV
jgi:hypothetical protein